MLFRSLVHYPETLYQAAETVADKFANGSYGTLAPSEFAIKAVNVGYYAVREVPHTSKSVIMGRPEFTEDRDVVFTVVQDDSKRAFHFITYGLAIGISVRRKHIKNVLQQSATE